MSDPTYRDPTDSAGRDASLAVVLGSLSGLVCSPEPAVVFSSLVRLCVPSICEAAAATIYGADEKVYAVSWPRETSTHPPRRGSVVTPFEVPGSADHPGYHGVVSLRFGSTDHNQAFIAQLLVERAMGTVERERLVHSAARQQVVTDNLEVALVTNREISVAVGILMESHGVTSDHAFDLLRRVSQNSNRKLHAIALEVVQGHRLELPVSTPTIEREAL